MRAYARFLIVVGYRADAVQNFFGDGSRYIHVDIQYARRPCRTAPVALSNLARDFVGDSPFVLSYGDILVDPANYKRVVDLPDDVKRLSP